MVANIGRILTRGYQISKSALKAYPKLVFSEKGADAFVKGVNESLKTSTSSSLGGTVYNALKGGNRALNNTVSSKGFWSGMWKSLKKIPSSLVSSTKAGARLARMKGTNQIVGGMKGLLSSIGKNMPLIGNVLIVATSLPTIFHAFKDEGLWGGIKEIAKEGTNLAGFTIGAAIGSALGPVGSIVGGIVGNMITNVFTGKSHDEKVAEQEEQQGQIAQVDQTQYAYPTSNITYPNSYATLPNTGYDFDFSGFDNIYNSYNNAGLNFNKLM
jgi:phage tail tape-measure protein